MEDILLIIVGIIVVGSGIYLVVIVGWFGKAVVHDIEESPGKKYKIRNIIGYCLVLLGLLLASRPDWILNAKWLGSLVLIAPTVGYFMGYYAGKGQQQFKDEGIILCEGYSRRRIDYKFTVLSELSKHVGDCVQISNVLHNYTSSHYDTYKKNTMEYITQALENCKYSEGESLIDYQKRIMCTCPPSKEIVDILDSVLEEYKRYVVFKLGLKPDKDFSPTEYLHGILTHYESLENQSLELSNQILPEIQNIKQNLKRA